MTHAQRGFTIKQAQKEKESLLVEYENNTSVFLWNHVLCEHKPTFVNFIQITEGIIL